MAKEKGSGSVVYKVKKGETWEDLPKAKKLNLGVQTLSAGQQIYVPKDERDDEPYVPPVTNLFFPPVPPRENTTTYPAVEGTKELFSSIGTGLSTLFRRAVGLEPILGYPEFQQRDDIASSNVGSLPAQAAALTSRVPGGAGQVSGTSYSEEAQQRDNTYYQAAVKSRSLNEIQRQLDATGSINTDLMFTSINSAEMMLAGIPYEQIEALGGVYNKFTGDWEMPSTAIGSKLRPGQAIIQALESLETTLKINPVLLPQYIYDDEASLYDFKGKDLKKLGGVYYPPKDGDPGFWYFPNSSQQAAPTSVQSDVSSGYASGATKKVYKGGGGGSEQDYGGGGGASAPALSESDLVYFEKLLIGDVPTTTAITQLEALIKSGRLSPEQLERAKTKLDDLRIMQTSSGSISAVWRIG